MTLRLMYKDKVVNQSEINVTRFGDLLGILKEKFDIDFSQYRLSDMKQCIQGRWMDIFLKEEDYLKYRDNKI